MNYGVFVRLEDGIEGLVHISEMSWTKRLAHPSELVNLGDEIEVVVLSVNKEKQEISLGLKQTQTNPWAIACQKYPAGTIVTAKVRSVANFGAFLEIEPGIDGMVHISDLSWTRKHSHPGEALQKGQEVKCIVLEVNEEKRRVSLGIKQMTEDPWLRAIPEKYIPGHIIKGKVAKLTNFGAFVELEEELEGLLHISELADHKIDKPQDIVKVDDEVEVKILKVDSDARKIGLSLRRVRWAAEDQSGESSEAKRPHVPAGPERVLSDADAEHIRKQQRKHSESTATDAEAAGADQQPAQDSEPEAAVAQAPEAEAQVTEEAAQTDASAEAPEKTAQKQSEQSPDSEDVSGDDAGQEQEKD
jgi:small subunit ribosomal protein S1